MSEESADLRLAVAELRNGIGDLKVATAELKVTVGTMSAREIEDREDRKKTAESKEARISSLERWRAWIQGQIAVVGFLAGGTLLLLVGRIFHVIP